MQYNLAIIDNFSFNNSSYNVSAAVGVFL